MFGRATYSRVRPRYGFYNFDFWRKVGLSVEYSSCEWSELGLDNLIVVLHRDPGSNSKDTEVVFIVGDIGEAGRGQSSQGVIHYFILLLCYSS